MSTPDPVLSRSPVRFLERAGLVVPSRGAVPRFFPRQNPVSRLEVLPPLLDPAMFLNREGIPQPDAGPSQPWPPTLAGLIPPN